MMLHTSFLREQVRDPGFYFMLQVLQWTGKNTTKVETTNDESFLIVKATVFLIVDNSFAVQSISIYPSSFFLGQGG
jgi:hypothetical protein